MKNKIFLAFIILMTMLFVAAISVNASTAGEIARDNYQNVLQNFYGENFKSPYATDGKTGNVNLANGGISLDITDLALPGKNGHDFVLKRRFDSSKPLEMGVIDYNDKYSRKLVVYKYLGSNGYYYNILFNTEEDMLEHAPNSFVTDTEYIRGKSLNYGSSSGYSFYTANRPNATGSGMVTLTRITTEPAIRNVKVEGYDDMYLSDSIEASNPIYCGWSFNIPVIIMSTDYSIYDDVYFVDTFMDENGKTYNLTYGYSYDTNETWADSIDAGLEFEIFGSWNKDTVVDGYTCNKKITDHNGKKYYFTRNGKIVAIVDRFGNAITFDYSSGTVITDSMGREILIQTSGNNKTVSYTEPGSNEEKVITYQYSRVNSSYDTNDMLITDDKYIFTVIDADNNTTVYEHSFRQPMFIPYSYGTKTILGENSNQYLLNKIIHPTGAATYYNYDKVDIRYIKSDYATRKYKVNRSYDSFNGIKNDFTYSYNFVGMSEGVTYKATADETDSRYFTGASIRALDQYTTTNKYLASGRCIKTTITAGGRTVQEKVTEYTGKSSLPKNITTESYGITGYQRTKNSTQYIYNKLEQPTKITNNGVVEDYMYDIRPAGTYPTPRPQGYYNLLLSKTYKRDASTNVKIQNTLTTDKKNIAKTEVLENGAVKSETLYEYDNFGNISSTKIKHENGEYTEVLSDYSYPETGTMEITKYTEGLKDADGNNADNIRMTYKYGYYGNLLEQTDPGRNVTTAEYDSLGRPVLLTLPDGAEKSMEYNDSANYVIATDENGNKVKQQYDPLGRLTDVFIHDGQSYARVERYTYNSISQLIKKENFKSKISPLGDIVTVYEYYPDGRKKKEEVQNANGTVVSGITYEYASNQSLNISMVTSIPYSDSSITPAKTVQYFDIWGRKLKEEKITANETLTETYTYDTIGNMLTRRDPKSNASQTPYDTETYTYNFQNKPLTMKNAYGDTMSMVYDALGNITEQTDFYGETVVKNQYDLIGRLIIAEQKQEEGVWGRTKQYYDALGNVVKTSVKTGSPEEEKYSSIENIYNSRNFLTGVITNDGEKDSVVQYTYDPAGNVKAMYTGLSEYSETPAGGAKTEYLYNFQGKATEIKDPMKNSVKYKYDLLGNVIEETDRNGTVTKTSYTELGKPKEILTQNPDKGNITTNFTYDILGNIASVQQGSSAVSYTYDSYVRLAKEVSPSGTSEYGYDKNGNRTLYKLNGTDMLQGYEYDLLNRMTKMTAGTETTTYAYNANNLLTGETTKDGEEVKSIHGYSYNKQGQVKAEQVKKNANDVISSYSYSYFLDGNQSSKTENGTTTSYLYDRMGRLKTETKGEDQSSYTYDLYGNRISMVKAGENAGTTNYRYNLNNQLLSESIGGKRKEYSYDKAGNLIYKSISTTQENNPLLPASINLFTANSNEQNSVTIYGYNAIGEMTSVKGWGFDANYGYDASGRRISKTVNGAKQSFIWDGTNIVMEKSESAVKAKYYRGANGLTSMKTNEGTAYYVKNAHGDIDGLISNDAYGKYEYDAFGNQKATDNSGLAIVHISLMDANPFRYAGEYQDLSSGLIYLRNRYYDPSIGRFTQEDPIKDGRNWYIYCANNPITWIDPSGLIMRLVGTGDEVQSIWQNIKEFSADKLVLTQEKDANGNLIDSYLVTVGEEVNGICQNGTDLVRRLINSNFTTEVKVTTGGNSATPSNATNATNGVGTGTHVLFNPTGNPSIGTVQANGNVVGESRPAFIGLAHEFIHADHNQRGTNNFTNTESYTYQTGTRLIDGGRTRTYTYTTQTAPSSELRTVGLANVRAGDITENMIRAEHGLKLRGRY